MTKEDFYEDFINLNLIKVEELTKELHISYCTRNALYKSLLDHEDAISSSGINFNIFIELVEHGIKHSAPNLDKLDIGTSIKTKLIKMTIGSLIYIVNQRIPNIIKQLTFLHTLTQMPRDIYYTLQETINWNISNAILKGDYYNFGRGLGRIFIKFCKRNFKKLVIDWGSSIKFKDSLINRGLQAYSLNSGGTKWFIYHTDDDFCYWSWSKSGCNIKNYRYYTFRAIRTAKTDMINWCKSKTVNDILSIRNLGNFDRMLAIIRINPKHKELYQNAI